MGTQGASQHSYTFDVDALLHDGVAIVATGAGAVGGSARVHDFGGVAAGTGVVNIAYTKFDLIVDVRAINLTVDETAVLILQLSDDADADGGGFDAGDRIINKLAVPFGLAGGIATSAADDSGATTQVGRTVVGGDNEYQGTVFRFARLFTVIAGTTSPSITPFVWMAEKK